LNDATVHRSLPQSRSRGPRRPAGAPGPVADTPFSPAWRGVWHDRSVGHRCCSLYPILSRGVPPLTANMSQACRLIREVGDDDRRPCAVTSSHPHPFGATAPCTKSDTAGEIPKEGSRDSDPGRARPAPGTSWRCGRVPASTAKADSEFASSIKPGEGRPRPTSGWGRSMATPTMAWPLHQIRY
jgi:hypothetical protein